MGDLTPNISRHEVACKCGCGFDTMDWETIEVVQDCCNYFARKLNVPRVVLSINSAARCERHNKKVGGGDRSQHLYGRAMDIVIRGVDPSDVYDYFDARYPVRYGVGSYATFTHIDTRAFKARW